MALVFGKLSSIFPPWLTKKTPLLLSLWYIGCSRATLSQAAASSKPSTKNYNRNDNQNQKRLKKSVKALQSLQQKIDVSKLPVVEVETVYETLPKAHKYIPKTEVPVPRFIWKEQEWPDGFPKSPQEAGTDLLTFLEQKDCFERLKKLNYKEFCVGSFVEVTYTDQYASGGTNCFRGICISKGHWQNTLGASFTLRNVIDNEALEINFQLYSPLIHKIQVLKHQRFKEHQLKYLRDYPPAFSYVSEKMKEQPYTEEPVLFEFNEEHQKRIDRWFARYYQSKQR